MRLVRLLARLAAALLLAALCVTAWAGVYSRELAQPGDFSAGIFERTEVSDAAGGVILTNAVNCVPYLWVPSPNDCVVSKIDARSGKEIARYRMGPADSGWSPVAVASDYEGSAYVACGGSGTCKIVKIRPFGGSKPVGAASETTSFDFNGDGRPEVLPWGQDNRVSLVAEVGGKGCRPGSLAFDSSGVLWVGLWGEQSIVAVDATTGVVGKTIDLDGKPDTMIAGSKGSLWVLCGNKSELVSVDTLLGSVSNSYELGTDGAQRMCLADDENTIWLGSSLGLARFDVKAGSVTQKSIDLIGLAGVALDRGGSVWAACPSQNQLVKFSPADLSVAGRVNVGRSPHDICADGDGYIWTLDEASATASKVDPRTSTCSVTTQTCASPYSSTPFASCVLKRGTSPSGSWKCLFDGKLPGAGWGTISWDATLAGGRIIVEARSADSPTDIVNQTFTPVMNGVEFNIPNGRYLEVNAKLDGGSNTTPILRNLLIQGRNLLPDVSKATPTMSVIRRQDHKFETVGITGVTDPEGGLVTIAITGVTQDEPVAGLSPDDKAPDAIIADSEVQLRGECDLGTPDKPGNGRVYTISFRATDPDGGMSTGKVKVMVPASLKWDAIAVEDKDKYDSTKDPTKEVKKS